MRAKISIGTNPWNEGGADKNLASLAEKFGGGGHPRVAAISLDPGNLEYAKQVARQLVEHLRS
jgi:nanoRNase/pAp phosphatase (c-di-AMP/oligoRNAs hydrolase)